MRTSTPLILAALSLTACGGEPAGSGESPFSFIEGTTAVDLAIGPAMGAEEVFVPVRGTRQRWQRRQQMLGSDS